MKKLLAILAVTASFASPVFAEAYGQWYDQDGGVCDDGPGSIQFNEGIVTLNLDNAGIREGYVVREEMVDGEIIIYEYANFENPNVIRQFVIDLRSNYYVDPFGQMPIVPCDTPEPQF